MLGFIVPNLDGPVTGGTLFNRLLTGSLLASGITCQVYSPQTVVEVQGRGADDAVYWMDSIFFDEVPALVRRLGGEARLGLLVHYLPSLVRHGDQLTRRELSCMERDAFSAVERILVPSPFLRRVIERVLEFPPAMVEVEPGRLATGAVALPGPPMRGILVANLLPGKGVLQFLDCLAAHTHAGDRFVLDVVGADGLDEGYGRDCRAAANAKGLREHVRMLGERSPAATIKHMSSSNLCVSASTMESYGMALAEARCLGLPIVARPAGNVPSLVVPSAGGEVLPDASTLAQAFLALCRDPTEHRRRMASAHANALPARPWMAVAAEFAHKTGILPRSAGRPLLHGVTCAS